MLMKRLEERGYARERIRPRLHSVLVRTQDPIDELVLIFRRHSSDAPVCLRGTSAVEGRMPGQWISSPQPPENESAKATSRARCCRMFSNTDASAVPDEGHVFRMYVNKFIDPCFT